MAVWLAVWLGCGLRGGKIIHTAWLGGRVDDSRLTTDSHVFVSVAAAAGCWLAGWLAGCGADDPDPGRGYTIQYVNRLSDGLRFSLYVERGGRVRGRGRYTERNTSKIETKQHETPGQMRHEHNQYR